MVNDWTIEEQEALRNEVPIKGLATSFRNRTVQDLAKEALMIASEGLKRRARFDAIGNDESGFLDTLRDIAERGRTPAEELLDAFSGRWLGSVGPVYEELRY
jgi:glutamate--cysteine ligase